MTAASARPLIMGIVNVTPDSFSDGGQFSSAVDAIGRGAELFEQGADIIDVGGESTRPGAERVGVAEEIERVVPVVRGLAELGVPVSVDTMNAETARAAIDAGAGYINDVSGGLADPEMYRVIAASDVTYIAMHWRGHSDRMQQLTDYDDVISEVRDALKQRVAELLVWGVDPERIVVDPGIGFSKTGDQNWQVLGHLGEFTTLGFPVLVGASRKRFLAALLPEGAEPVERDPATAIISALSAQSGAWAVRVHNVAETKAALDVWSAWQRGASA